MLSKFKNLFLRSDLDEKNAFRNRVTAILRAKFPEVEFSAGDEVELINYSFVPGDIRGQLGLTNIYASFLQTSRTAYDLQECVESTFGGLGDVFATIEADAYNPTWDEVRSIVIPQLMPREYASQMDLVNQPFGDEVLIGFVIDREHSYSYITEEFQIKWGVSLAEISEQAHANLWDRSQDLEFAFVPEPDRMIALNSLDGFDATRILLPQIREFIAEKLGGPFHFGVPNRDFLICWAANGDGSFREKLRRQVADDFAEQPYSLSGAVFEIRSDGEIVLVKPFAG